MRRLFLKVMIHVIVAFGLFSCHKGDKTPVPIAEPYGPKPMSGTGLFLGLVAFNATVTSVPMTEDTVKMNASIRKMDNEGQTSTGLCYAIERGIKLLKDLNSTHDLDQGFIIAFTDGADNFSSNLFAHDNININQIGVVPHAVSALNAMNVTSQYSSSQIKCYTIGYSSPDLNAADLYSLAVNGDYKPANSSNFSKVFQEVANSLIQTSKNVAFSTNITKWPQSAPKHYSITLSAFDTTNTKVNGTIRGKFWLENVQSPAPTFSITGKSPNLTFKNTSNIINGRTEKIGINEKAVIPFDNLTFRGPTGQALITTSTTVEWSVNESGPYQQDTEDAQYERPIAKNIGVVLVLDCSSSLGPKLLSELRVNSINLISTVLKGKK